MNTNVVVFEDGSAGFGVIFKDHAGQVLMAASGWHQVINSPLESETQPVNKKFHNLSNTGLLFEDINILSKTFSSFSLTHCCSETNQPTDHITRIALISSSFIVWMEEVSISITPFIDLDVLDIPL